MWKQKYQPLMTRKWWPVEPDQWRTRWRTDHYLLRRNYWPNGWQWRAEIVDEAIDDSWPRPSIVLRAQLVIIDQCVLLLLIVDHYCGSYWRFFDWPCYSEGWPNGSIVVVGPCIENLTQYWLCGKWLIDPMQFQLTTWPHYDWPDPGIYRYCIEGPHLCGTDLCGWLTHCVVDPLKVLRLLTHSYCGSVEWTVLPIVKAWHYYCWPNWGRCYYCGIVEGLLDICWIDCAWWPDEELWWLIDDDGIVGVVIYYW